MDKCLRRTEQKEALQDLQLHLSGILDSTRSDNNRENCNYRDREWLSDSPPRKEIPLAK